MKYERVNYERYLRSERWRRRRWQALVAANWICARCSKPAAEVFGHQDGGELVRKLYGHPDARLARERVRRAYEHVPAAPVPLVAVVTG